MAIVSGAAKVKRNPNGKLTTDGGCEQTGMQSDKITFTPDFSGTWPPDSVNSQDSRR